MMMPFEIPCVAAPKPLMPDGVQCTFVDENDGRLKYGPGWMLSAFPFGSQSTVHIATTNGSSVVVDFNGESRILNEATRENSRRRRNQRHCLRLCAEE